MLSILLFKNGFNKGLVQSVFLHHVFRAVLLSFKRNERIRFVLFHWWFGNLNLFGFYFVLINLLLFRFRILLLNLILFWWRLFLRFLSKIRILMLNIQHPYWLVMNEIIMKNQARTKTLNFYTLIYQCLKTIHRHSFSHQIMQKFLFFLINLSALSLQLFQITKQLFQASLSFSINELFNFYFTRVNNVLDFVLHWELQ